MTKEIKLGLIQAFIEASKDIAKETANESIPEVVSAGLMQVGAQFVASTVIESIPVLGHALMTSRQNRKIKNTECILSEIDKRVDEIEHNLSQRSAEENEKLDDLFAYVYAKASETNQQEKISHMVNGFVNMTKMEGLSSDIAYIYYDTLDQLTLLDLAILKFFGRGLFNADAPGNLDEILESFGIEYHQYTAVRENLRRMTLLEDADEEKQEKYLKEWVKVFNENVKKLKNLKDPKKFDVKEFGKLKSIKDFRTQERLRISKFGKEFLRFFVEEVPEV